MVDVFHSLLHSTDTVYINFMPDYLANAQQDLYSSKRLGSSFSDAIVGMAQDKAKQRLLQQQLQMEQAHLQLAQQTAQPRMELERAQTAGLQYGLTQQQEAAKRQQMMQSFLTQQAMGPEAFSTLMDPQRSGALIKNLRSAGVLGNDAAGVTPESLQTMLHAAARGMAGAEAASTPSGATQMFMPEKVAPGQTLYDPLSMNNGMPTTAPESDYQRERNALLQSNALMAHELGLLRDQRGNAAIEEKGRHNFATEEERASEAKTKAELGKQNADANTTRANKGKGGFLDNLRGGKNDNLTNRTNDTALAATAASGGVHPLSTKYGWKAGQNVGGWILLPGADKDPRDPKSWKKPEGDNDGEDQ